MNKEEFINELKHLDINISVDTLKKLDAYYHLLVTENAKYNLTTITEESAVYLKHFYDSLTIVKSITLKDEYLLDIGSGAGFPGLVLKIVFPELKVDLLDSTAKKCHFLEKVITELDLKNIHVICARAEDYAQDNREKYDIITSRAVAPLKHLLEYAIPLLKIGGTFVSLKGNITEELNNIDNYYKKLYLANESIINFNLPHEAGYRTIYKITKTKPTPKIYPRSYSQIKKRDI